jgi:hypothetical protein
MTSNAPVVLTRRSEAVPAVRARALGWLVLAGVMLAGRADAQSASMPARRATQASGGLAPAGGATPVNGLLSLAIGRGLRFNNPYRLETPLGDTAESVSAAATYLDMGIGVSFGRREFRHGALVTGSVALQGIGQFVLTPSYLGQLALTESWGLRGRVGVPIVVAPDTTAGLEASVGTSWLMAYGLGALVELVGDVFFGAATDQTSITTIPMLSLQVGVFFDHQVLP